MVEINHYLRHLEWEFLQNNFEIRDVEDDPNLPQNIQKIELWRNKHYDIQAKLLSKEDEDSEKSWLKETNAGDFIDTFTINGKTTSGLQVELHDCYIEQRKRNWDVMSNKNDLELDFSTNKIEVKYPNDSETYWLTDWYLNGSDLFLPRLTNRKITLSYKRFRDDFDEINTEHTNDFLGNASRDFAYIDTGQIKFFLTKVNDDFGPEWSHNFSIEYRREFDFIPSLEQREAISEIVSFILGKQLVHVGYTNYGCDGQLIEQCAISPPKANILSLCQKSSSEPIKIGISDQSKIESTLNELVPSYLELRDDLDLNVALHIYWASLEAPLGTNLPILASALEIIMKKWFKSTKSKTKALYMEKQKFDELLKKDLEIIFEKLENEAFGTKIFNKIKFSYNMSVTDRFQQFFDEIDIEIGDIENSAIRSRHKMAHGDIKSNDEMLKEMSRNTLAYETLFHRVFLKILGYNGYYIDRSTLQFPNRHINTQLGGDGD